jgi:putative membrane protein
MPDQEYKMTRFFLRWLINAVALYAAVTYIPGISQQSPDLFSFVWLALIFGLLNTLLRPLLKLLTFPLIFLTLGLFTLVINTFLFWLVGVIGANFDIGFTVIGFWPAFLGGLVVSVVSMILNAIFKEEKKKKK